MNIPEWLKPGIYGAAIGAVFVSVVGFTWGGWVTPGDALEMADNFAAEQVTLAMVPVCLGLSEADAERIEILATLRKASGYLQLNAMMETGWATLPGTDTPSRDLADACLAELALDGS